MTLSHRHLTALTPTSAVSDLATVSSGLHDAAAREAVARLLARVPAARTQAHPAHRAHPARPAA